VRAEPDAEGKFQWLARLGFAMRGLLYVIIALLVLGTGRTEDLTGALEYLGHGIGRGLLIVMVAGLTGYGLWRLGDAAFGMDSGVGHPKAWRRRIAAAASGSIYLFLAFKAAKIMIGGHVGSTGPQQNAATAMHFPKGEYLVGAAAVVGVGAGLVQLYKAGTCSFLRYLDDRARRTWIELLGRIGYAARGVIFLTVGYLLARSAFDRSPAEAGGLKQALEALSSPLRYPVAAGLMVFGFFSVIEARYRSIHRPPVEKTEAKVREKMKG
jgi:hypothetical protein